ncbi:MAG: nucleotidyltransferase/DNA polymerase involved in repair [Oscillospiraceae bacterium]|nr:nucleotidyltransferase/DNA polymerase involved in repair [Oscillospiraceae bacterium]
MNSFYASVELLYRLQLQDKPVAASGDAEQRHGIILTANRLAKSRGVKTGQAIWQARQTCPNLVTLPPDYKKYIRFSHMARKIYLDYTDKVEPFGIDEAWLDVSGSVGLFGSGEEIANIIRHRIRSELGITTSVGVSFNKVFAKLGSGYKKPDATTVISKENFQNIVWPLPAKDLLYVGSSTARKLYDVGILTIGQLAEADLRMLELRFGKWDIMLWRLLFRSQNNKQFFTGKIIRGNDNI